MAMMKFRKADGAVRIALVLLAALLAAGGWPGAAFGADGEGGADEPASLRSLTLSVGQLSPAFAPDTTRYTVELPQGIGQVAVTAEAESAGAQLTIDGMPAESGVPVVVDVDVRPVVIRVATSAGTTAYTIEWNRPYVYDECLYAQADWIFCDDFQTNRLNELYYDRYDNWGRFSWHQTRGIGGGGALDALYGYYPADTTHAEPYETWLKLAFGRTPNPSVYKPAGDPEERVRELYWRFYIRKAAGPEDYPNEATGPFVRIHGYGENGTPFMGVAVDYPDDTGVLKAKLMTGVFDASGLPLGTVETAELTGTRPIMKRSEADQQWHRVEIRVKLNTPGEADGEFGLWIDGVPEMALDDLDWVGTYDHYGINAVEFRNLNNQPGVPTDSLRIDNMVLSRRPIGAAGTQPIVNNANLAGLNRSAGKLVPHFQQDVTAYTLRLEHGTAGAEVTPVLSDEAATLTVNGAVHASGVPVAVRSGDRLAIDITAVDGVTTRTYTVDVVEEPPFLVNECAFMDPDWLFCDDFEADRLDRYFERTRPDQFMRTDGVGLGGSQGMAARWRWPGDVNAGDLKIGLGRTPDDYVRPVAAENEDLREVYWRFYVKHEPGWQGHGADKLTRATILLPAAYDEHGNEIRANWSQAMIAHVWSGAPGSARQYKLTLDPASGTDPQGNVVTTRYNDFDRLRWLGVAEGATPLFDSEHVGEWYAVEVHVKLNDPGESNGVFELWIDDELDVVLYNLNWVGSFQEYGINAIFIENYWNDGSVQAQERYFDNLVVSRSKIGLAVMDLQDGFRELERLTDAIAHPGTRQAIKAHIDNAQRFFDRAREFAEGSGQAAHFTAKGCEALEKAADKIAGYGPNHLDPDLQSRLLKLIDTMLQL
jgi:hypothetical protein